MAARSLLHHHPQRQHYCTSHGFEVEISCWRSNIAKELALDLTYASWVPLIVEHIPGISNVLADRLSRRKDPAYADHWQLPPALDKVPQTTVPVRSEAYYFL